MLLILHCMRLCFLGELDLSSSLYSLCWLVRNDIMWRYQDGIYYILFFCGHVILHLVGSIQILLLICKSILLVLSKSIILLYFLILSIYFFVVSYQKKKKNVFVCLESSVIWDLFPNFCKISFLAILSILQHARERERGSIRNYFHKGL